MFKYFGKNILVKWKMQDIDLSSQQLNYEP